jgi:hypothetical protein
LTLDILPAMENRKAQAWGSGGAPKRSRGPEDEFKILLSRMAGQKAGGRCLYPVEPACSERPCKAHSIQNGTVLNSLAEDGHVVAVRFAPGVVDDPGVVFGRFGRNVATTFTGLCARHDAELFAPIDRRPLDLQNREQMFLLAYRSVMRDAHASRVSAEKTRRMLDERRRLGLPELERPPEGAVDPVEHALAVAESVAEEKELFDKAYLAGDFGAGEHEVARTPPSPPGLAVSSLICVGDSAFTGKALNVALNVFPYKGRHATLLSFRRPAKQAAQNLGFALMSTIGEERFRAVSCLVLKNCENLVLRPSLFRSFGRKQRRVVSEYFGKTTFAPHFGPLEAVPFPGIVKEADERKLNLFQAVGR